MTTTVEGVPRLRDADALAIARAHYDLGGRLTPLPSYADQNFRIDADDGERYVLRIANAGSVATNLEAQLAALDHLACKRIAAAVPSPIPARTGDLLISVSGAGWLAAPRAPASLPRGIDVGRGDVDGFMGLPPGSTRTS